MFMQLLKNWLEGKTGRNLDLAEKELLQKTFSMGNRANTARKLINKSPKNNQPQEVTTTTTSLPESKGNKNEISFDIK